MSAAGLSLQLPAEAAARGGAVRQFWRDLRQQQLRAHQQGAPAFVVARALADGAAAAAAELFAAAQAEMPAGAPAVALIGLGGLGRRELAPFSDLDLGLICAQPQHPAVAALAERLFYPLWDAGLEVGHAVRSPGQFARLVQQDTTVRTAAIDCRGLAGDAGLIGTLQAQLQRALQAARRRKLALEACEAWAQAGLPGSVFELQPDVKQGPGGLREVHRLWWLSRLLFGIDGWEDLVRQELMDRHDLTLLQQGHAALLGIRLAMHFVANRRLDHLRFELQDEVAAHLGLGGAPAGRLPADRLLQQFYLHAQAVRGVAGRVLERSVERLMPHHRWRSRPVDGFARVHGRLLLSSGSPPRLGEVLQILRTAQRHGLALHAQSRAAMAALAAAAPLQLGADEAAALRDLLVDPSDRGAVLTTLFDLGLLGALLPELLPIRGLTQRDLYHVHTVDAHLVDCCRYALLLLAGADDAAAPPHRDTMVAVAARLPRPQVLVWAALWHDVGKGQGGDHSEIGADIAAAAADRLQLASADRQDVIYLVRHHLAMFRISQRRDLEDRQLLQEFARSIGSAERLDLLLVLSFADAVTTGPQAWSAWKGDLLLELYRRTRALLQDAPAATPTERLAALLAARPAAAGDLATWATRLLPRHLDSYPVPLLLRQFDACEQARTAGIAVCLNRGGGPRGWELLLVGPNRAGLLRDITGVLAAWAVSIDAAQISGTQDGQAIDTLVLRDRPVLAEPARAAALCAELQHTLAGTPRFAARLLERQKAHRAVPRHAPRPRTRIQFEPEPQAGATVVDVYAADRVGLLHDLSAALSAAGAEIALARVNTEGERAIDAFYLIDSQTRGPLSAAMQDRVAAALQAAVTAD